MRALGNVGFPPQTHGPGNGGFFAPRMPASGRPLPEGNALKERELQARIGEMIDKTDAKTGKTKQIYQVKPEDWKQREDWDRAPAEGSTVGSPDHGADGSSVARAVPDLPALARAADGRSDPAA